MEELSIEEKAKRYDEAIKIAKDSFNYPDYPGFIRAAIVFPELIELENEKIRKSLINYFENFHLQTFAGLDPKKILAWLKAQNHWKPSKELLETFDYYMDAIISDRDRAMFLELYNYLKQL